MNLVIHVLVSSAAVYVTSRLLRGVTIDGFGTAILVSLVLGFVNAFVGPLLLLLTLPLNVMTLGFFTFVVIAALVLLTSALVPGFHVAGWWWALGFAFVLTFVNSVFHSLARPH